MATAQETITTAMQALKVLGVGQQATTAQDQYALRQLNSYIRQLAGFSGSLPMRSLRLDSDYQVTREWPALRLQVCTDGITITLPDGISGVGSGQIADGFRLEVVDVAGGAASSNITIARNGWMIAGLASNYTISTNSAVKAFMFRADLGDWKLAGDLALADSLPFPTEFDEAIALNLARRLTLFGQHLAPEDQDLADRGASRIRARYAKPPVAVLDPAAANIGGNTVASISLSDFTNGNF